VVGEVFGLRVFAGPPSGSSLPSAPRVGSVVGEPGGVLVRELAAVRLRFVVSLVLGVVVPVLVVLVGVLFGSGVSVVVRNVFLFFGLFVGAYGVWVHVPRLRGALGLLRRLSVGLEGERRVCAALAGLGSDFVVLNSLDLSGLAGGVGDADHVVVGPGGVVVVDAKLWGGLVDVSSGGVVSRDGVVLEELARGSVRRAGVVGEVLGLSGVRAVVAFAGSGGASLRSPVFMSGADFVALGGLVSFVRSVVGSGGWSREDVELAARKLGELVADVGVGDSGVYLGVVGGSVGVVRWGGLVRVWVRLLASLGWFGWFALWLGVAGWGLRVWGWGGLGGLVGEGWLWLGAYVGLGCFAVGLFFSRGLLLPPSVLLRPFRVSESGGVPLEVARPAVVESVVAPSSFVVGESGGSAGGSGGGVSSEGGLVVRERVRGEADVGGGGGVKRLGKESSAAEVRAFFESELVLPADTMDELLKSYKMLVHADDYRKKWGVEPSKGLILYGPPGTGKTHAARTLASAAGMNFIGVQPSEVRSMWVGKSAEMVRDLYASAREKAPTVVFIDEIDAVGGVRSGGDSGGREVDHAVNQLLTEIDGLDAGSSEWSRPVVFTMGATNRLDSLDPALLSRLSRHVRIGLPDRDGLRRLWEIHLRGMKVPIVVPIERFVELSERMSGRAIAAACSEIAATGFFLDASVVDEELVVSSIRKARTKVDFASSEMRNG
jgi:hypothetical protein